jgi:hypothetical protein
MSPCEIRYTELTTHSQGTPCGFCLQSDTGNGHTKMCKVIRPEQCLHCYCQPPATGELMAILSPLDTRLASEVQFSLGSTKHSSRDMKMDFPKGLLTMSFNFPAVLQV